MICPVCRNARWVCEDHPQEPMHHKLPDGSTCGGAGMPCPRCNEKMDQKPDPSLTDISAKL